MMTMRGWADMPRSMGQRHRQHGMRAVAVRVSDKIQPAGLTEERTYHLVSINRATAVDRAKSKFVHDTELQRKPSQLKAEVLYDMEAV